MFVDTFGCKAQEDCLPTASGVSRVCYVDPAFGSEFLVDEFGTDILNDNITSFCSCGNMYVFIGDDCGSPTGITYFLFIWNWMLFLW